jgi:hypothetical protein
MSASASQFHDGLGERRETVGASNQPVDVLVVHEELSAVPRFDVLIRERVQELAAFQHRSFPRVLGVGRLAKTQSRVIVASGHVAGTRLSRLLSTAEQRLIRVEFEAAFGVLRQLVDAVAALHEKGPDAWHGALSPERLVLTAEGRLMVAEHVLGTALEDLRFSHERYWKELRVALPRTGGLPRFDQRGDVTQIGVVALALILGRPLGDDEYPARVADLVEGVRAMSASGLAALPAGLRSWLTRALQLDSRHSFASAIEAQAEMEAIAVCDERRSIDALCTLLAQCQAPSPTREEPFAQEHVARSAAERIAPPTPERIAPPAPERIASPAPVPPTPRAADIPPPRANTKPQPAVEPPPSPTPVLSFAESPRKPAISSDPVDHEDSGVPNEEDVPETTSIGAGHESHSLWRRGRMIAVAAGLVGLATAGGFAARSYARVPPKGTLVVTTSPSGVEVVIDGQPRGVSPLTVDVEPGDHMLEVASEGQSRTVPVTMTAGGQISQFIELPTNVARGGQLSIRTEPPGASVSVDGKRRGVSPLVIDGLTPGVHVVRLENALGAVTEQVTVEAGETASLVVPLAAPQPVAMSGWLSISSPIELQISENGRALGSSGHERITIATGRHQVDLVNEALGYQTTRVVQVTPGQVTPISVELPNGSLALNAMPWAEVWVDGQRVGETPIGNMQVRIGTHDVLFKHPELGEQQHTVTVTATAPARLSADLRKP